MPFQACPVLSFWNENADIFFQCLDLIGTTVQILWSTVQYFPKGYLWNQQNIINFIFDSNLGSVYFLDDRGKCKKCYQLETPVKYLLYHESRDAIVVVTENLMLSQHSLQPDGEYTEISKVNHTNCIFIIPCDNRVSIELEDMYPFRFVFLFW